MSLSTSILGEGGMANRGLSMRKIKEVLRLKYELGLSNRAIARSCNIYHKTVKEYLKRAKEAGLGQSIPTEMDDETLEKMLFPKAAFE
jgi:DNA-binding transcriptional regulator LsrR (DeoR family)